MTVEAVVMTHKARILPRSTLIWCGCVGLAFFLGAAVANGHVTNGAVEGAVQQEKGDCHWLLGQEHKRHVRPHPLRSSQFRP